MELGLQTADDNTAAVINRGYKADVYERACEILNKYGIPTVTHIMIGLPSEGDGEIAKTAALITKCGTWGVKIHSVYVARGTRLCRMYEGGEYTPITREDYVRRAAYVITHISPDTVVHRLTGDCPRELFVAPEWSRDKNAVIAEICSYLSDRGEYQGKYFVAE